MCLNVSRSFGLRQVLAGHPCRCRVGIAHGRSRIDVEVVREQLGGQGILCVEDCGNMGWVVLPNRPMVGGTTCFTMGRVRSGWLSKFQFLYCSSCILNGLGDLYCSRMLLNGLDLLEATYWMPNS